MAKPEKKAARFHLRSRILDPSMHAPNELMNAALRVLSAIGQGRAPDEGDLQILKSNAQPDERILSIDELADEVIKREIAKRRTARAER